MATQNQAGVSTDMRRVAKATIMSLKSHVAVSRLIVTGEMLQQRSFSVSQL